MDDADALAPRHTGRRLAARVSEYRVVLMDKFSHPEFREYRVCEVQAGVTGDVTAWTPDTPAPRGESQEEAHAACLAMAGAFYLPVLRETELP